MKRRTSLEVILWWTILTIYQRNVEAGPMQRINRVAREVYPEIEPDNEANQASVCIVGDVVYGADEPVSSEQPCLKCKCQPPGVQCETIRCMKKPGCKAIHKPNRCCPDYQCECEHNGKIYTNGEKLETQPGGECKVCYCRGGEVKCAEVSCYRRADCEGKTVPGQCCPKYDHCPPKDPQVGTPQVISIGEHDRVEPWSLPSTPANNTFKNDDYGIQNENHILDSTQENEPTTSATKEDKSTQTDALFEAHKEGPKITIQEIIPEVPREIPITEPPNVPKPEIGGHLIIEEAKSGSSEPEIHEENDLVTDSDADSSEISEVLQQPPPVLRVGDKLVFLKNDGTAPESDSNTSASVITVHGAEGLEAGFADSGEVHEVQIKNESESSPSTLSTLIENSTSDEDLELKESESTHILSLVKRRRKEDVTTETSTSVSSEQVTDKTISEQVSESFSTEASTEKVSTSESSTENTTVPHSTTEIVKENDPVGESYVNENNAKEGSLHSDSNAMVEATEKTYMENIHEQNPAYPPIPDIMSPLHVDETADRFESDLGENGTENGTSSEMEMRILPEILEVRSNKTIKDDATHGDWLKSGEASSGTLLNMDAILPKSILDEPADSDFQEGSIETTTQESSNATDINSSSTTEVSTSSATLTTVVILSPSTTTQTIETTTSESNSKLTLPDTQTSKETMEDELEDSGEQTTPKSSHASMISTEEADIDSKENITAEVADMVPLNDEPDEKIELTTKIPYEVEMIDHISNVDPKNKNLSDEVTKLEDVEFINVDEMSGKMESLGTTTELPEKLPMPETLITGPTRSIEKRENSPDDEADVIFKQLNAELNADNLQKLQTKEEEEKEADKIFKELLDETSTPASTSAQKDTSKEAEMVRKVTDALARLTLRGRATLDRNLLSTLSSFFTNQYRAYDTVKQ